MIIIKIHMLGKLFARASKYILLREDSSFTPKGKYKDIYEKLKKNNSDYSHIEKIRNDYNKDDDDKVPIFDRNLEMEIKKWIQKKK